MSRAGAMLGCVLAACGDDRPAAPDPAVDAAVDATATEPACIAAFSENFTETWLGPADCANLVSADGHTALAFTVPAQAIHAPLAISIDLGAAPTAGTYSSQTLATPWSASALHELDLTSCLYHAGTGAVPPGTFRLALDTLSPHPHGRLDLVLYVLARPYTYCGESNIERVALTF